MITNSHVNSDDEESDYLSVKSSHSSSDSSSSDSSSSDSSSSSEEEDPEDGQDLSKEQKEDLDYIIDLENKILALRREAATAANIEDANFIDAKIKDMEEFVKEAKIEFGFAVDEDMTLETANKKRGRKNKNGNADADAAAAAGGGGGGGGGEDDAEEQGDNDDVDDAAAPAVKKKRGKKTKGASPNTEVVV